MTNPIEYRNSPMPPEMQMLLHDYPRDRWESHPGFREKTRNWLGAHQMFRRLSDIVRKETETYLDKNREGNDFAGRLSHYGGVLVGNLHGHHGWEDRSYFPELSAADPRFDRGLEILEQDHATLDRFLDELTISANRTIKLVQLDEAQAREEASKLRDGAEVIEKLLCRHLSDEEELAVPIILHHRLRG